VQIIHLIFCAHVLQLAPVVVGHTEPLRVAGADVDVHGAEVVVLLMAGGPRTGHLHVQLHRVHAQDLVAYVRQHVARRHDAGPRGQLVQFSQLRPPFFVVAEVTVGAEFDHAPRGVLAEVEFGVG